MSEKIKSKGKSKKQVVEEKKLVKEENVLETRINSSEESVPDQASCQGKSEPQRKTISTTTFLIICGVLCLVILGSVLIPKYLKQEEFKSNKYNNFEFYKTEDGYWMTVLQKGPQKYYVPFYYHPKELEDIPVETYLRAKFFEVRDNNGSIFITLDPDSTDNKIVIAGVEIARITGSRYDLLNVPTRSAFIKQPSTQSAETGTPIVTCKDANNQTLVIWLTMSDLNVISSKGYCVIVEGKTYDDLVRGADRLMYHLLGIMK